MNKIITKMQVFLFPLFLLSSQAGADIGVSAVFSKDEITIIAEWYQNHDSGSVHGNGKKRPKACRLASKRTSHVANRCRQE